MSTYFSMPSEDFLLTLGPGFLTDCHSCLFPKIPLCKAKISFLCLLRMARHADAVDLGMKMILHCLLPHPYLHHAKGCGNCYISDMTMLYTHIILFCLGSKWLELEGNFPTEEFSIWKCWLDWIEMFCGKVLIPSKLLVETKQALCRLSDGPKLPWLMPAYPSTRGFLALWPQDFPATCPVDAKTLVRCRFLQRCLHGCGSVTTHSSTPWVRDFDFESLFWFLPCFFLFVFFLIFHPTENGHALFHLSDLLSGAHVLCTRRWCPFVSAGNMISSSRIKLWKHSRGCVFSSPFCTACSQLPPAVWPWQSHLGHCIKIALHLQTLDRAQSTSFRKSAGVFGRTEHNHFD